MTKLYTIDNSIQSYQSLIALYEANKDTYFSTVHLELRSFFAANMSATLGAILDLLAENVNDVRFDYIKPNVEAILLKNDFLTFYGRQRAIDTNRTTIKYQKLKPNDGKYFKAYVIDELLNPHIDDLPRMSSGVREKIVEAIYEIFVNAQIHSESKHIYTCGQFYPQKNKIEFTIVDTGIGFKEKVNQRFGSNLSAEKAIEWAVQDRKTTKVGISGGLGLAILKEFIERNNGKMQIVSDSGFYQFDSSGVVLRPLSGKFPGTIVNLQFRTDDATSYSLKSEIDINDIF